MEYLNLLAHGDIEPWDLIFEHWMIIIAFVASLWSLIWCWRNGKELAKQRMADVDTNSRVYHLEQEIK